MVTGYVIRILSPLPSHASEDTYVSEYTADGFAGRGHVVFTHEVERALHLPSHAAAMALWRTQSATHPTRADGKPNRPLTAYTIEILPVEVPEL